MGSAEVSPITAIDEVATGPEEVVMSAPAEDWTTAGDEDGATETEEDSATMLLLAEEGGAALPSSALTHPVLAVRAAGQETCVKSTVGLSDPSNQSKRQ